MMKYVVIVILALVVLVLSFAGIRGTTSRQPPILLFDDMVDQPKYKPQSQSPFFPDGRTLRPAPAGTVPFGRPGFSPSPAPVYDDPAAFDLKQIPLKVDAALLTRGQQVYSTYCTVCHGAAGTGNGIVTQYNSAQPANYHSDRLRGVTDGYLYKVITEGKGLMGAYGPSIRPEDRWAAVAYLRALQRSQNARLEDVPQAQRQELERSR